MREGPGPLVEHRHNNNNNNNNNNSCLTEHLLETQSLMCQRLAAPRHNTHDATGNTYRGEIRFQIQKSEIFNKTNQYYISRYSVTDTRISDASADTQLASE